MARITAVLVACLALLLPATAAAREREVVYVGQIHDGQGYSGRFYPAAEHTIFVLADVPNVLVPRATEVYWWPITREYKPDWSTLNQALAGTLEIDGRAVATTLFSLRHDGGYDSAKTSLITGAATGAAYDDYKRALQAEQDANRAYSEARAAFEREVERWGKLRDERQAKGESTADLHVPDEPLKPEPLSVVVTQPQQGFALTLAAGTYRMRLRDASGQLVPGSERTVVAFSHRREGVAYKVIAASKWTRPETSVQPDERIYVQGERALYIQPALEREYDAFQYAMLLSPQQTSVPDRRGSWTWAQTGPYTGTTLAVARPGRASTTIERAPFYVRQREGSALGYDILPFTSTVGSVSTFEAFELRPEPGTTVIDVPGLANARREVRVVGGATTPALLLACLPLAGLVWVGVRRWRSR